VGRVIVIAVILQLGHRMKMYRGLGAGKQISSEHTLSCHFRSDLDLRSASPSSLSHPSSQLEIAQGDDQFNLAC
jgi:hypothetical protein